MRHPRSINLFQHADPKPPLEFPSRTAGLRECRVFFRDRQGVEHAVYVKAANRYHAFGLALNELRRCPWANADQVDKLRVELMNTRWRALNVTRPQFEAWIGPPEDALRKGDRLKLHMLMLLKRMEPDREFQHWLQSRRD